MVLEALVVLLLILINGFFALSEMAVVTSRKARLKQLAQDSRRADRALALSEHPEKFLSSVQVGITSIGILSGAIGEATLARERQAMEKKQDRERERLEERRAKAEAAYDEAMRRWRKS